MTKVGSILKNKGITLLTKVCIINATVSPVVMGVRVGWTIKKAECQKIDTFKLC